MCGIHIPACLFKVIALPYCQRCFGIVGVGDAKEQLQIFQSDVVLRGFKLFCQLFVGVVHPTLVHHTRDPLKGKR
jgi:hypothetical protein